MKHTDVVNQFFRAEKEGDIRLKYPLNKNSIVLDLGAYKCEWAKSIVQRYGCKVYAFEPAPQALSKLANLPKQISLLNYGLGGSTRKEVLYEDNDASSSFSKVGKAVEIEVRCITEVLNELGLKHVGLLKINIEGLEYEVLDKLIEDDWVPKIDHLQIQFHQNVPDYEKRRDNIRLEFQKTHAESYCFPFVWESWSIK